MKQVGFFIIGILFLLYSCNNDLKTIGQDMIGNGNYIGEEDLNIQDIGTVRIDSFITSPGLYSSTTINQFIMGKYTDEYGGTTTAIPCFQVAPTYRPSVSFNAVLDSLTLHFKYGGKIWGDTIYQPSTQKYTLYQLKKLPELDYDDYGYFYNTSKVDYENAIATTTFLPKIQNINRTYFKIDQNLAEDLFDQMIYRDDDDIFTPNSSNVPFLKFLLYFKGLAIVPDDANDCLISISALSDSLYMQFNYRESGVNKTLRFPISQREYQYNNFTTDRSARFQTLTNQEKEVSFAEAKQIALAQGLSGYMVKMILPPAPQFPIYTTIVKAELEIKPEYFKRNPIPYAKQITVYTTDDLNRITGTLKNTSTSNVVGKLVANDQATENTRYTFDVTEYYQSLAIGAPTTKGQQVLLSVPDLSLSYDYMVVREKPIVRIYYANYKQ